MAKRVVREWQFSLKSRHFKKISTAICLISESSLTCEHYFFKKTKSWGGRAFSDSLLVELLSKVPTGEEIPTELYQTIAEVLAFVYQINEKFKQKMS
jgi:type III secretion system FlhB-like substrate exporter